jgi:heme exporter protein D
MGGWEILAWLAIALVTVLRVALVVGVVAIVVAIVRGVRAYEPASRAY